MTTNFIYQNAKGEVRAHSIGGQRIQGAYLQGFEGGKFRTFLLDRIIETYDDAGEMEDWLDHHRANPPAPVAVSRPTDERIEVLFTGFPRDERELMEIEAGRHGMKVVKSVTQGLGILCVYGDLSPGRFELNGKIPAAQDGGALVMDENDLQWLWDFGEIRDHD
ncbi:hypothetical protein P8631_00845 [Guyparkeria sp. 1SP6A2]|nr:hypothetical protein [Guyparkeria sp. 1SP6A2]